MAIQRRRVYTPAEVDRIIRASERRPSLRTGVHGHVGGKHVLITNVELADRADTELSRPPRTGGPPAPLACAFAGTPEAVQAVTEALNSAEGQSALQFLDDNYPTGIRVTLEARVTPLVARYSGGMQIVRTATVPSVLVLLERTEEPECHGLHVHTGYPVLFFRRGRPAWQDSRGTWH